MFSSLCHWNRADGAASHLAPLCGAALVGAAVPSFFWVVRPSLSFFFSNVTYSSVKVKSIQARQGKVKQGKVD